MTPCFPHHVCACTFSFGTACGTAFVYKRMIASARIRDNHSLPSGLLLFLLLVSIPLPFLPFPSFVVLFAVVSVFFVRGRLGVL